MRDTWRLQVMELVMLSLLSLSPHGLWSFFEENTASSIVTPASVRIPLWRYRHCRRCCINWELKKAPSTCEAGTGSGHAASRNPTWRLPAPYCEASRHYG
ncbi:hypothetical protein EDC04DRAFT_2680174 [Pisolithus marmoratus]|nr:hypothetical protein EDC04DRAFT_2680174 [Pisolithus marmoratus]